MYIITKNIRTFEIPIENFDWKRYNIDPDNGLISLYSTILYIDNIFYAINKDFKISSSDAGSAMLIDSDKPSRDATVYTSFIYKSNYYNVTSAFSSCFLNNHLLEYINGYNEEDVPEIRFKDGIMYYNKINYSSCCEVCLVKYPRNRKDKEFKIPDFVNSCCHQSFYNVNNLKYLYLNDDTIIHYRDKITNKPINIIYKNKTIKMTDDLKYRILK